MVCMSYRLESMVYLGYCLLNKVTSGLSNLNHSFVMCSFTYVLFALWYYFFSWYDTPITMTHGWKWVSWGHLFFLSIDNVYCFDAGRVVELCSMLMLDELYEYSYAGPVLCSKDGDLRSSIQETRDSRGRSGRTALERVCSCMFPRDCVAVVA